MIELLLYPLCVAAGFGGGWLVKAKRVEKAAATAKAKRPYVRKASTAPKVSKPKPVKLDAVANPQAPAPTSLNGTGAHAINE